MNFEDYYEDKKDYDAVFQFEISLLELVVLGNSSLVSAGTAEKEPDF